MLVTSLPFLSTTVTGKSTRRVSLLKIATSSELLSPAGSTGRAGLPAAGAGGEFCARAPSVQNNVAVTRAKAIQTGMVDREKAGGLRRSAGWAITSLLRWCIVSSTEHGLERRKSGGFHQ